MARKSLSNNHCFSKSHSLTGRKDANFKTLRKSSACPLQAISYKFQTQMEMIIEKHFSILTISVNFVYATHPKLYTTL